MILTFMGMSGAGKSFWAAKFAAQGFTVVDCDALVAASLQTLIGQIGTSLDEVGQWMGLPDQPGFRQREALYLACETDMLRAVVARALAWAAAQADCVIDTGGNNLCRSDAAATSAAVLDSDLLPHPRYAPSADAQRLPRAPAPSDMEWFV